MTMQAHQAPDAHDRDHSPPDRCEYVNAVIAMYRSTPGTLGHVRTSDRRLARQLFDDGVHLDVVRAALILAASRRQLRPPDAPSLEPIRSLFYFRPVINEILRRPIDPLYLDYLERRLAELADHEPAPTD
jgi:hypothetical protein